MAGIFQDAKWWRRRLEQERKPPRTAARNGRRGCLGSKSDPYPGTYHVDNCRGYGKHGKTWWDNLKNQRY